MRVSTIGLLGHRPFRCMREAATIGGCRCLCTAFAARRCTCPRRSSAIVEKQENTLHTTLPSPTDMHIDTHGARERERENDMERDTRHSIRRTMSHRPLCPLSPGQSVRAPRSSAALLEHRCLNPTMIPMCRQTWEGATRVCPAPHRPKATVGALPELCLPIVRFAAGCHGARICVDNRIDQEAKNLVQVAGHQGLFEDRLGQGVACARRTGGVDLADRNDK